MQHVLFIVAGNRFPAGCVAFLETMRQREEIHVRGLFFEPLDFDAIARASKWDFAFVPLQRLEETDRETVRRQKSLFSTACQEAHIPYSILDEVNNWNKEIFLKESRFADLIVISDEFFYAEAWSKQPNLYLRDVLHTPFCPIIVVPESYT